MSNVMTRNLTRYLPDELLQKLKKVNGSRYKRLLQPIDIYHAVMDAKDNGWSVVNGGTVNYSRYPADTTLCLCVLVENNYVAVDIGRAKAYSPSPGSIWESLSPFDPSKKDSFYRKTQEWGNAQGRHIVDPILLSI